MARPVAEAVMRALAEARALGFLGPGPLKAHVASAEHFADAIRDLGGDGPALDLGSGGGVPGLLLAGWFDDWTWVLFDAHRRRTSFLAATIARLGWSPRVSVVRARAEVAGHGDEHRERYGVVTARSFGPPPATAEAASAFVRPGGVVLISEPPGAPARWNEDGLRLLGLRIELLGDDTVRGLRKTHQLSNAYPRDVKAQRSRPVF